MYTQLRSRVKRLLTPSDKDFRLGVSSSTAPEYLSDIPNVSPSQSIRLLTYNIQVGISTSAYRHYLTRSWQHFLPHAQRQTNLVKIASLLEAYDVVALQEVDGGSLRTGFVNQVEFLAKTAGFPFWYQQLNRNFGPIAQHSNGLLSRFCPLSVEEYPLPSLIPGRGVIVAKYGDEKDPIVLVILHLSLSSAAQKAQLSFVKKLIDGYQHIILMGDMNTHLQSLLGHGCLSELDLVALPGVSHTFPSWQPRKDLDHILVSRSLEVRYAEVLPFSVSDHLPIALEFGLPETYIASK
ncbi:endonuclease [Oleiphilus sp. HI0009]|nr:MULTISPECIES: endonuclease/exonuclease/phosphatase family protein [unclassified Oleiphilus]KZX86006.1 endonuclease [Oleiphilus sp. HI0009]MCH2160110.1 endonuclease/exonuclease/phosphatase family protein [Oleiphilaceae bacterium]KZY65623.1 endonuclease [Oleiphilus sp. HI0066]KZY74185.1 endonuclease [Oleiphilus sp. HI0067]KZZ58867.1 endonuclease [Oleiphilus sp. HI0125]